MLSTSLNTIIAVINNQCICNCLCNHVKKKNNKFPKMSICYNIVPSIKCVFHKINIIKNQLLKSQTIFLWLMFYYEIIYIFFIGHFDQAQFYFWWKYTSWFQIIFGYRLQIVNSFIKNIHINIIHIMNSRFHHILTSCTYILRPYQLMLWTYFIIWQLIILVRSLFY